MLETRQRTPKYADAVDELLPIDEIHDRYHGEWILLRVVKTNERGHVTHGNVLAHTKSPKTITKALTQAVAIDPNVELAEFIGGTRYLPPDEVMRRLEELADQSYVNAHW